MENQDPSRTWRKIQDPSRTGREVGLDLRVVVLEHDQAPGGPRAVRAIRHGVGVPTVDKGHDPASLTVLHPVHAVAVEEAGAPGDRAEGPARVVAEFLEENGIGGREVPPRVIGPCGPTRVPYGGAPAILVRRVDDVRVAQRIAANLGEVPGPTSAVDDNRVPKAGAADGLDVLRLGQLPVVPVIALRGIAAVAVGLVV